MVEAQSAPEQPGAVASASTDGGAYVAGPINTGGGDFVGRDQHVYLRSQLEELRDYLQGAMATYVAAQQACILKPPAPLTQPYKFLDSFDLEDADNFFGRDAASAALHQTVMQTRLTVLHARSGAGKTSLLQAGLAPRLIREGRIPIFTRAFDDPVLAVKRAIAPASAGPWPALLSRLTLAELLGVVCPLLPRRVQELVLIFDQFEEFFVFWPARGQRQPFIDDFAACYDDKDLPVRFVISLRKDYFSDLADFQGRIPAIFRNQFRLEAMSREEAVQAITAPVARLAQSVAYTQELLDALLDDLHRGGMELPHLQIICTQLYERVSQACTGTIDLAAYDHFGRALGILGGYLNAALARFPGATALLAKAILKELVSSEKTRRAVAESALASHLEATRQDIDDTLARLVNARLVRRDEMDGEILYELAHDYLAAEIAAWMTQEDFSARIAHELLSRQIDNWRHNRLLIPLEALPLIHERRDQIKRLNTDELELLFRSALAHSYEVPYWFGRAGQGNVAADAIALEGLRSDSFRTRAAAVTALAELGERFADDLIPMLADDYPQVRVAAIAALERLRRDGRWRTQLKYECYVPAGEFIMGDDKKENSWSDKKATAHRVHVNAFYAGKYPVTNTEYARFMADRERGFETPRGKERHPVVNVSWYDARDYAEWAGMRLLTEAEWEKAASWAVETDGHPPKKRVYPWGDTFDNTKCNTEESGVGNTTLVGKYLLGGDSPYGCADMAGNVWEWCSSQYRDYPYRARDGRENLTEYTLRVLRGGSFFIAAANARCATRLNDYPGSRDRYSGFRVGWAPPSYSEWGHILRR